jgi:hypothetical protein
MSELEIRYAESGYFGRLVQGDYLECAMKSPRIALRVALILKTFIKSFKIEGPGRKNSGLKHFRSHGIRLAVAVAPLRSFTPEEGIIDGEAIYLSGRAIKNFSTSDKQKIVIKNTMFFRHQEPAVQDHFDTIFSLLDTILSKCSSKQSEILYYKLLNYTEKDISLKVGKYQSTISQHSTSAGWMSIEKAVNYFENSVT